VIVGVGVGFKSRTWS